jgi:hypothetical protein
VRPRRTVLGSFFDVRNPMEAAARGAPTSVGCDEGRRLLPGQTPNRQHHRDPRAASARTLHRSRGRRSDGCKPGEGCRGRRQAPERRRGESLGGEQSPWEKRNVRALATGLGRIQTRQRMKALKSTFTSFGAHLFKLGRRATNRGRRAVRSSDRMATTCGPTTEAIGATRWRLRTGVCGHDPPRRAQAHPGDRTSARRREYLRVPRRRMSRSW